MTGGKLATVATMLGAMLWMMPSALAAQDAGMHGHQDAPPPCAAPAALPQGLQGWANAASALTMAGSAQDARAETVTVGTVYDMGLKPTSTLRYAVTPRKLPDQAGFGGLAAFHVARPGRYQVVQDGHAWVDVIGAGKALASAGHGHGLPCSGITKMVAYDLAPGRYVLQVAGNGRATLKVMIVPVG
ncbi:hypothetical protein [Novosphingobium sp. Leaf2]|uniref:hypothetical protein n=1 Tax=Novosphingobium sp. Leaf2 TaxID=1735670 RepID=UPI0006FBA19E|nr:hypothetical protein [Novosphingobium sp. Leaf2]KQM21556.1 hypothetical protein ASE49_14220 [Novosphingobium sp. Leaf2]